MWIISIKLIYFFYKVGKGQKQICLPLKWGLIHLLLYIDPIDNSFNWQTIDIVLIEISQCLYYCDYLSISHCWSKLSTVIILPFSYKLLFFLNLITASIFAWFFNIKFSKCSHLSAKSPLVVLITFLFLLFLWFPFSRAEIQYFTNPQQGQETETLLQGKSVTSCLKWSHLSKY